MGISNCGFTLVELLVVVGMIGILSVALLATLDPIGQIQKGWDAQRKSDLSQIQKALEQYYQDNGRYPASSTDFKIRRLDGTTAEWGTQWVPYITQLPKDPRESSSRRYIYYSSSDGQSYRLYAALERGNKDPQACERMCPGAASIVELSSECDNFGGGCNYGVTSPNVSP